MHKFLYFISHYRKKRENVRGNSVLKRKANFTGQRGILPWGDFKRHWSPSKVTSCPQTAVCNLAIKVADHCWVSAMCQVLCLSFCMLFLCSSTSLPILKIRWRSKSEKDRLGKMGRNPDSARHVALVWWYPHCPDTGEQPAASEIEFSEWHG